jgi:hypothetical protein
MVKYILGIMLGMGIVLSGMAYAESQTILNQNISSKQSDGKGKAAMPDPCLSPPSPPAGPVPVPYPDIGKSSDTAKGTKKVKTEGKEIMLKGSHYKKSAGDEKGTTSSGGSRQMQRK